MRSSAADSGMKPQLQRRPTGAHHPPDDGDELRHGQLLGNKKLGFVQERKVLLLVVPLNNDLL